ncbi:MAG: restriction endonuclease subunit S [Victivallales bacterium]|nr:restriction endonuclease subunit S [Victivallales bacterium]
MSYWRKVQVTEFSEVVSGGTPATTVKEFWAGNILWLTPADLSNIKHPVISTSQRFITVKGLENSSAVLIPKNNIVMSSRAPIGYFAVVNKNFTTNQGCKSFIIKRDNSEIYHYYNFLFNKSVFLQKGAGSTFAEISKADLEKIRVLINTNPLIQRKIAKILTTVDNVIEKTEQAIEKYKAIKKGMMHDLFTRGIDINTGKIRPKYEDAPHLYKQSELGLIPKEWEVNRLIEMADIIMGQSPPSSSCNEENIGIPFLQGCTEFGDKYPVYKYSCTDGKKYAPKNSILISVRAPVGDLNIANKEYVIGRGVSAIITKRVNRDYLYDYILLNRNKLEIVAQGSTFTAINSNDLHDFIVYSPQETEQNVISNYLISIDNKIEKEEAYLNKLQKIKQGLMQDLLTGKVEVKI